MSEKIKHEIEDRLLNRLHHLKAGRRFKGTTEHQVKYLVELYIAYAKTQARNWPKNSDVSAAENGRTAASNLLSFINLDPFIGPVRNAITALMAGNTKKALGILQKIVDEQDQILGEIQSKNRKGKTKDSSFKDLLRKILRANPTLSSDGVLKELKKEIGNGVIKAIKYDTDQIITSKNEEYKISGLKDHIYKIKRSGI
jgi:hypothetical protein